MTAPGGGGADEIREQPKPREVLCGCGTVHHAVTPRERLIVVLHALANEDFDWRDAEWFADALLPTVQALIADAEKRAAARALNDAADKWQRGAWANTPRHADQVADRIGAAQYVTDWLRARVAALDGTP